MNADILRKRFAYVEPVGLVDKVTGIEAKYLKVDGCKSRWIGHAIWVWHKGPVPYGHTVRRIDPAKPPLIKNLKMVRSSMPRTDLPPLEKLTEMGYHWSPIGLMGPRGFLKVNNSNALKNVYRINGAYYPEKLVLKVFKPQIDALNLNEKEPVSESLSTSSVTITVEELKSILKEHLQIKESRLREILKEEIEKALDQFSIEID